MNANNLWEWLWYHRAAEAEAEAETKEEGETSGTEGRDIETKEGMADGGEKRDPTKREMVVKLV